MENAELSQLYIEYKPLLFSLAYKMTGSNKRKISNIWKFSFYLC